MSTSVTVTADQPLLVAVFDGMGGHSGGGVASRLGASVLAHMPVPLTAPTLAGSLAEAHRAIAECGASLRGLQGMGTTVVGFIVTPEAYRVFHVGDSRAYRWLQGALGDLAIPHRAADSSRPGSFVLTQALGVGGDPQPSWDTYPLRGPVRLLLASDGVADVISAPQLKQLLSETSPDDADLAALARRIVESALASGSRDNLTAVVLDLADEDLAPHSEPHHLGTALAVLTGNVDQS